MAYFILPLTLPVRGALLLDHIAERSSLSFLGPQQSWAQNVPIEGLEPKLRPLVVGVGEPVGAGLVLKGSRPLFARRLLFTSQCSLPGLPASQTPIFRVCTTLWRRPHGHAEELLGLQWEDADFDRRTIRHTVSGSIVAQHWRHRCVVLRLAYFLPLVPNGKRSSVFGIIG